MFLSSCAEEDDEPIEDTCTPFLSEYEYEASATQIDDIHNIIGDNFRPTQDFNGRTINEFN
ncbi:MAG: hypothetical protein ACPG5B_15970 [Chitinophagales bacterium]